MTESKRGNTERQKCQKCTCTIACFKVHSMYIGRRVYRYRPRRKYDVLLGAAGKFYSLLECVVFSDLHHLHCSPTGVRSIGVIEANVYGSCYIFCVICIVLLHVILKSGHREEIG